MTLWSPRGPAFGKIEIRLDGRQQAILDLHSDSPVASRPIWTSGDLPEVGHAVAVQGVFGVFPVDCLETASGELRFRRPASRQASFLPVKGPFMQRPLLFCVFFPVACLAWGGDTSSPVVPPKKTESERRPSKIWQCRGPLGETPQRVTDAYPLSDQQNKAGWVKFEPMSDEFEGQTLDAQKWTLGIVGWRGRQPALFSDHNVTVSEGKLNLTMHKEKLPAAEKKNGYHDYTSAALHSNARSSYGYYEVKARPMNSGGSSPFWFAAGVGPDWQTEIDVFELCGSRGTTSGSTT